MLRRTFLTLLGAVAWPWRKAEADNGVTWSETFTIPRRYMSHGTYKSKLPTVAAHSDVEAFRQSLDAIRDGKSTMTFHDGVWFSDSFPRAAQHE